ncbi:cation:proton antiporter [uncultured Alsobacter sp.]|uniref:cation:proton antiporter domain-containing protein n=1 Tax=uncultured Alsobacter sp. TaxID=1748258 RepID=UPI0025F56D00|nr:cation:proton antiporter [uncultured Alsobacter sp.]
MDHHASLIATVAVCFALAAVLGFAAHRVRLPPLVGYLLAGVLVGPFTPGFRADADLAGQLAEMGVILLMFGVGLHFSPADLTAVRGIAVPGALGLITVATLLGTALALAWGWSIGAGVVFGLCLSVASTVVVLRALEERNAVSSTAGRVAIGWLLVEDMVMVLVLVLLPGLAGAAGGKSGDAGSLKDLALSVALTLGQVAGFVVLAIVLGPRVVPNLLKQVARTGSRELFTLAVLGVALGIAYGSAVVFGVSFALGAFFAGVVLNESPFGHRAAAQSLPMQDAFAVLFFVSVGMLFDPTIIIREPGAVLAVLGLVILGKAVAAVVIVMALGYPLGLGLTLGAALARIGEFSFILAGLGASLGVMPAEARDLVIAAALLSITLSSAVYALIDRLQKALPGGGPLQAWGEKTAAALEQRLEAARLRAEAREAEHSLKIQTVLGLFPMFADLDHHAREDLLLLFRPQSAAPGDRVIRIGDKPDAAYFISEGTVQVDVAGREILLSAGDVFGEMALLSGDRRSATVTALDFCQFYALGRRDFLQFLSRHPELRARLSEIAVRRRQMNAAPEG